MSEVEALREEVAHLREQVKDLTEALINVALVQRPSYVPVPCPTLMPRPYPVYPPTYPSYPTYISGVCSSTSSPSGDYVVQS